jgi:CRISPR-associated protein Cas2
MDLLLAYDIDTRDVEGERRLRRVAKIAEGHGVRVQYSVFELIVNPHEVPQLLRRLELAIDHERDSIRIYRLGLAEPVSVLGKQRKITTTRGPLIF